MNWLSLLALFGASNVCHPVAADRILSDDLARAVPALSALPAGIPFGYSPAPGVRRIVREEELLRVARQNGIQAARLPAACFAVPMLPVGDSAVTQAMLDALKLPSADLRIVDAQPRFAPPGKLVFPRSMLLPPPRSAGTANHSAIWHGYVEYAAGRRFSITAKIELEVSTTRVVASANLSPGEPIPAASVRLETVSLFPTAEEPIASLEQIAGCTPRHLILSGQPISTADVAMLPAVLKGDRVQVEVRNGSSLLSLEGEAESPGYIGQMVQVKNLATGKRFPAKVESARLVVVIPKGGAR